MSSVNAHCILTFEGEFAEQPLVDECLVVNGPIVMTVRSIERSEVEVTSYGDKVPKHLLGDLCIHAVAGYVDFSLESSVNPA